MSEVGRQKSDETFVEFKPQNLSKRKILWKDKSRKTISEVNCQKNPKVVKTIEVSEEKDVQKEEFYETNEDRIMTKMDIFALTAFSLCLPTFDVYSDIV